MNKDKHSKISYSDNKYEIRKQINRPTFCDTNQISDRLVERHTTNNKIQQNVSIQVGKIYSRRCQNSHD